jgi:hypothetical protein
MAQKVQVSLVDDLDGGRAAETVTFGLDGTTYQIDLSAANAATLRAALATYIAAARRPSGRRGGIRATTTRPAPDREYNQQIRVWARSRGLKVPPRGRIPSEVIEAFDYSD